MKDPDLRNDPPAAEPYGLPLGPEQEKLALIHSGNAPDTSEALGKIRSACGDAFLIGEVYLPSAKWQPYLDHLDVAFAFELLFSPWEAAPLRRAIEVTTRGPGAAWVMSNHDFGRLATRFGAENARAVALMLLTLPGVAFLYQGDEIGQREGPPGESHYDRVGRDRYRHPMQWTGEPTGGFTTGTPWLPLVDPAASNVEAQRDDPGSMLSLVRKLIALRRTLGPGLRLLDAAPGVLAYERGEHTIAVNTTGDPLEAPAEGPVVLETQPGSLSDGVLAPHAAIVTERLG
jgi:alpha-glucosidase